MRSTGLHRFMLISECVVIFDSITIRGRSSLLSQ